MTAEIAFNFAYPVVLGVIFLVSHVVTFRQRNPSTNKYERGARSGFRAIWGLQALLCILLVGMPQLPTSFSCI